MLLQVEVATFERLQMVFTHITADITVKQHNKWKHPVTLRLLKV